MLAQFLKEKVAEDLGVPVEEVTGELVDEARKRLWLRNPKENTESAYGGYLNEFLEVQDDDEIEAIRMEAEKFWEQFV